MAVDELSELVGEFYRSAGTSNGLQEVPPEENIDGQSSTQWFRADFEDPVTTISSEIMECHDELAVNDYLGSISILHSGLIVYAALVNRNNTSDHANRRFSVNGAWVDALGEVTFRYRESSRP